METKQIIETDSQDTVKPTTNSWDSLKKGNYSIYSTIWHDGPIENNKNTKTVKDSSHMEDQENQYKHFF